MLSGFKDKQLYRFAIIFNANLEYHCDSFFYFDYKMKLCSQNAFHPQ